jgi:DNA-binding GntR family transcriptional regulator
MMATSGQDAYATIREQIISGEYAMGARLGEAELATALGVSRTPIREALRRLSADGLVEAEANRGARVASWTPDDLDQIYELRALLEGHAAARAATRVTPEDLEQLAELCDRMEEAVAAGITRSDNLDTLADGNRRFHARIMAVAGNPRLHRLTDLLFQVPLSIHTYRHYSVDELDRSMRHHREILEAFRHRDVDWAGSVWRCHILAARHSAPEADSFPSEDTSDRAL